MYKYVRATYFKNFIIFLNFGKLAKIVYFAIFTKKVLILDTVRDRAKRMKIEDHKVDNM